MSAVTRLQTHEEAVLPCPPDDVWGELAEVSAYPTWWPGKLKVSLVDQKPDLFGTEIRVKPFLGRAFCVRFEEVEEPRVMRIRFFGGSLEGPGSILIEPSEAGTRVCFDMDVFSRGLDVAALSFIFPLRMIHAVQIRGLLKSLARRIRAQRRAGRKADMRAAARSEAFPPISEQASGPTLAETVSEAPPAPVAQIPEQREVLVAAPQIPIGETPLEISGPPRTGMAEFARRAARWLKESPGPKVDEPVAPSATSTAEPRSNFELALAYLEALLVDGGLDQGSRFLHGDLTEDEFPDPMASTGKTRDLAGILRARSDQSRWTEQGFELLGAVAGGSQVALEILWTGTAARRMERHNIGEKARARVAMSLKFQDQLIVHQRTYVCFEPVSIDPPAR